MKPLTVKELIKQLRKLPPATPILFYTFGHNIPQPYTDGDMPSLYYDATYHALVTIPDEAAPHDAWIAGDLIPLVEYKP